MDLLTKTLICSQEEEDPVRSHRNSSLRMFFQSASVTKGGGKAGGAAKVAPMDSHTLAPRSGRGTGPKSGCNGLELIVGPRAGGYEGPATTSSSVNADPSTAGGSMPARG